MTYKEGLLSVLRWEEDDVTDYVIIKILLKKCANDYLSKADDSSDLKNKMVICKSYKVKIKF